jgi:chemotaxis protein CheD
MSATAGPTAVNLIPVRMGEMAASRTKDDAFSVIGLGSCVAVILIAPERRAAALAHVVLPEQSMTGGREAPPGKFADTALPALLAALRPFRVRPEDTYAVLVGGATMFGHTHSSKLAAVGERNIEAARQQLVQHGIGIASEDVGGTIGRSVQVTINDLAVQVRSGAADPVQLKGSVRPLRARPAGNAYDLRPEPNPKDVLNSGAAESKTREG